MLRSKDNDLLLSREFLSIKNTPFKLMLHNSLNLDKVACKNLTEYIQNKYLTDEEALDIIYATHSEHITSDETLHGIALYLRGLVHHYGTKTNQYIDYTTAINFYDQARACNNVDAANNLALMYCDGLGCTASYPKAIELLEIAVSLNHTPAMINLARLYTIGIDGVKQYGKAITLLEKAISLDDSEAMCHRARMHLREQGEDANILSAIRLLNNAMQLGNVKAFNILAMHYYESKHYDDKHFQAAHDLLQKAMGMGDEKYAPYHLAQFYLNPKWDRVDISFASSLLERSIRANNPFALIQRGDLHLLSAKELDGKVERNKHYLMAVKLYQDALHINNNLWEQCKDSCSELMIQTKDFDVCYRLFLMQTMFGAPIKSMKTFLQNNLDLMISTILIDDSLLFERKHDLIQRLSSECENGFSQNAYDLIGEFYLKHVHAQATNILSMRKHLLDLLAFVPAQSKSFDEALQLRSKIENKRLFKLDTPDVSESDEEEELDSDDASDKIDVESVASMEKEAPKSPLQAKSMFADQQAIPLENLLADKYCQVSIPDYGCAKLKFQDLRCAKSFLEQLNKLNLPSLSGSKKSIGKDNSIMLRDEQFNEMIKKVFDIDNAYEGKLVVNCFSNSGQ